MSNSQNICTPHKKDFSVGHSCLGAIPKISFLLPEQASVYKHSENVYFLFFLDSDELLLSLIFHTQIFSLDLLRYKNRLL